MSNPPGDETTAAAERFVPGATIESVDGRSWLVSATTADGRFSVRQLDPALPATRIELIREFLAQPDLRNVTPVVWGERSGVASFDARQWVSGTVLGASIPRKEWTTIHLPTAVDAAVLGAVAESLGVFHRTGASTSLLARIPRFRAKDAVVAVRRSLALDEHALAGEIRKESRARRWLTASRPLLANAESNLEQAGFMRDEPLVIAHGDLWGSHVVTGSDGEATFLDCATIVAAPAAVDLAQILARNGPWSDDRVEQVLNGYTAAHAFPPLQRRLLPWLTALDAITHCGHLLAIAENEHRPLSDSDRRTVLQAADIQIEQLQALATRFVPPPPRPYRRPGQRRNS
jgi:hypothetical protein